MAENGITELPGLQSWLTGKLEKIVESHGRRLLGWDEIMEGGLSDNAVVMSWRGMENGLSAIEAGHDTADMDELRREHFHQFADDILDKAEQCRTCRAHVRTDYRLSVSVNASQFRTGRHHFLAVSRNFELRYHIYVTLSSIWLPSSA